MAVIAGNEGERPYRPPKKKTRPHTDSTRGRGGRPSGGSRGTSSSYGVGARIGGGGRGGGFTTRRGVPGGRPAPPRYTGPPAPSAQAIQQLYAQIGDIRRQLGTARGEYRQGTGQLRTARTQFLAQLADYYKGQQQSTAQDFATRGLSQSGLLDEALAQLAKQRGADTASYEQGYQNQLAQLLQQFTQRRSDLTRQRSALEDRYNQSRSDRARILQLMGA